MDLLWSSPKNFLTAPLEKRSPSPPTVFHIVSFLFPLSGAAVLEHSVHISVIQAQWALHQQQQCYANPVDSFHLSSLCFFPFSSLSFLLTFVEDPAITLLRDLVQSKTLNNQSTHCIKGKQRPLSDRIPLILHCTNCYFCIM